MGVHCLPTPEQNESYLHNTLYIEWDVHFSYHIYVQGVQFISLYLKAVGETLPKSSHESTTSVPGLDLQDHL